MSSIMPPPTGGGNFKYVIVVVLLLGGIAGLFVWKSSSNNVQPVVARPFDAAVPPPVNRHIEDDVPPPPEIPDAGPDTGPVKAPVGTGGTINYCNVTKCGGAASADLESALAFRAKQAHSCYDTALASDVSLKGRVSIAVRVAANGQVCTASVASNELGNPGVAQCVANKFRQTGYFPAPKGGCIDVTIPINFTPGGK